MSLNNSSYVNETLVPRTPRPLDHTIITLYSILLVWSLLGNLLVIAVVYCNQYLRTNMNHLIVNMAVSDLLVPLIALPWRISGQIVEPGHWLVEGPLGEALCKLVPFFSEISPYVSSISLAIIAFHRFIAVVYPTRLRQISTRKTRWILIAFPWVIAMAIYTPDLYTYRLKKYRGYKTTCVYSWSPAFKFWPAQIIFISIAGIVGSLIPLISVIIFYTIMQHKLRKSLNIVMELIERETIRSRQRRNRRIFNMSVTIILMFIVCWCPLGVLQFFYARYHYLLFSIIDYETYLKLHFATIYMWYLLAAINPCIYFLFLRDFKQGLKRLCCRTTVSVNENISTMCACCSRNVVPGGDSNQNQTCTSPHINTTSV